MKKLILVLLLLSMALCACGGPEQPTTVPPTTQAPTKPPAPTAPQIDEAQSGPVRLVNVGSFKHKDDLMFASGDFLLSYDKSNPDAPYEILSPLAEPKIPGRYNAATYLGNGVALVSQPAEGHDLVGLVDYHKGIVLAPCEAVRAISISSKYCMLIYAEQVLETEEGAFYHYNDAAGNKVYFTGYARVIDITTGMFVPELNLQTMPDEMGGLGQYFYVRNGKVTDVYNANGTLKLSLEDAVIHDEVVLHNSMGGVFIYDNELNQLSQLKHASQRLTLLSGGYLRFYEEGTYQVLDLQGNRISEDAFLDVKYGADGKIVVYKEEGLGMISATGEEILPCQYLSIDYIGRGRFLLTDTEGNHSFFGPDGVLVEAEFAEIVHNDWYCGILTDGGCDYLLRNGEQLSLDGKITEMDHGLISNEDGLYELYTGGKLLSGYSIYAYCDGYVYAGIYGIWTVFRVEITE